MTQEAATAALTADQEVSEGSLWTRGTHRSTAKSGDKDMTELLKVPNV